MAPKGAKRQAAAASRGAASKKARVDDGSTEKCNEVIAAMKEATQLPEDVRAMLAAAVKGSIQVMKDQRHPHQEMIATWIGEALTGIEASLNKEVADAKAKVEGAGAEQTVREAAKVSAEENLAKLKETASEAKATLANDTTAHKEATKSLADAKSAQKTGDAAGEAAAGLKSDLEATMTEKYAPLKEGTIKTKKATEAFVKACGKIKALDASLLQALPGALVKDPEARSSFEGIVMTQFEEAVQKQLAEYSATLEAAGPAKETRASEVTAAEVLVETSSEKMKASAAALHDAQAAVKQGEAAVHEAVKALKDLGPATQAAEAAGKEAEAKITEFQSGPSAAFVYLRDRTTPPPPAETPAEPEPEAAVEAVDATATEAVPMEATEGEATAA